MTNYFLCFSHGHSAGGWILYLCNNHPSGRISVLGEVPKPNQLDFARRGMTKKSHLNSEILKFFRDREDQNDACAGIVKSFTNGAIEFVTKRKGVIFQKVMNPLHIVGKRMFKKPSNAAEMIRRKYGHAPLNKDEEFEGHCLYYGEQKFEVFLNRADKWPIVRIEDLNESLGVDGFYFKRVMEGITQTEWPQDYIDYIRHNCFPNQHYVHSVHWDEHGRVKEARSELRDPAMGFRGEARGDWGENPLPARAWAAWTESQQAIYHKYFDEIDKRLGYNQRYIGSTEPEWEMLGKYIWGSP